jgi:hypothetical protein
MTQLVLGDSSCRRSFQVVSAATLAIQSGSSTLIAQLPRSGSIGELFSSCSFRTWSTDACRQKYSGGESTGRIERIEQEFMA